MGSLLVGTSNSSATALVDGGMVTVTNTIVLGNIANTRWNTLQVNSGSLTVSGLSGIQISTNTTFANSSQVRLTGGTTTTEAINFGVAASVSGSQGYVDVGSGATLYVGSGSVNLISLNSYTTNFTANGGTIGAKAIWTSTVPVALNATSTFKTADAADASFDITLNGGVSGAGGLTKTGDGTLTLGVVAPSYGGDTTVSAGTLSLAQANASNQSSTVSIAPGAFLNLNFTGTDTVKQFFINGVQQLEGIYEAVGNPGSGIEISSITGTGTLTVSGSGFGTWINGTFAKRQPLASDITYSIVQSTDLGISDFWDPVTPLVNDGTTISYTLPGGSPKDFVRLKVVQN
jgi:autotransporter-associated beta strand protein